jgi:hypothetical protein
VNGATVSLGGRYSTDYYDLAVPAFTLAICPPTQKGTKAVPALLALQFIRRGRSLSDTLARRTGFETCSGDYEAPSNPLVTIVTL